MCCQHAEFVSLLKQGGMGALELVAMELKGAGAFVSRSLSWTVRTADSLVGGWGRDMFVVNPHAVGGCQHVLVWLLP